MNDPSTAIRSFAAALALAAAAPAAAQSDSASQLNKAIQAYNDGDYDTSAFEFYDLVETASATDPARLKAEYYLAQSFFRKRLFYSALYYYRYILRAGRNHPYYLKAVEGLVNVAEELRDDVIIPSVLNLEYNDEFAKLPAEVVNKINYFVGLMSYRNNKLEEAHDFLNSVPADSAYYARGRYLSGIVLVDPRSRRYHNAEAALKAFDEVVRLKTGKITYTDLDEIKDLATLALARTYYGLGQYDKAVQFYEAIRRFSEYWDFALFENGWARFQNDDPGGALGSLQALHAPQFAGSFQPESWILKATAYYFACLYDDVNRALKAFDDLYQPMNQQMKKVLEGDRDFAFYYRLVADDRSSDLPKAVKNHILGNKRVQGFLKFISHLEQEKEGINAVSIWRNSRMAGELNGTVDQGRQTLLQVSGKFIKGRVADAASLIIGFEGQAEIIRFETSKAEKDVLEQNQDQKGHLGAQTIYRPKMPSEAWEHWKFNGEFWLDEIGYYQFTLKNGCIVRRE